MMTRDEFYDLIGYRETERLDGESRSGPRAFSRRKDSAPRPPVHHPSP